MKPEPLERRGTAGRGHPGTFLKNPQCLLQTLEVDDQQAFGAVDGRGARAPARVGLRVAGRQELPPAHRQASHGRGDAVADGPHPPERLRRGQREPRDLLADPGPFQRPVAVGVDQPQQFDR